VSRDPSVEVQPVRQVPQRRQLLGGRGLVFPPPGDVASLAAPRADDPVGARIQGDPLSAPARDGDHRPSTPVRDRTGLGPRIEDVLREVLRVLAGQEPEQVLVEAFGVDLDVPRVCPS
jgi:hypothetical protein